MESTNTFGKNVKNTATMGAKYRPTVNSNPGPGQYSGDSNRIKSSKSNCKIGTTKRPDIWEGATKVGAS